MGNREIIEFFSQKLETRDFLKSSLLKNEAATPLQPSCRSCLWAQAAASVREQLGAAFQALALGPGLRYPGALSSLPSPPAAADASPAAASNLRLGAGNIQCSSAFLFFFFFLYLGRGACRPIICTSKRNAGSPFFLASQESGWSSAWSPSHLPSACQGTRSSAAPVRSPLQCASPCPGYLFFYCPLSVSLCNPQGFCLGRGG